MDLGLLVRWRGCLVLPPSLVFKSHLFQQQLGEIGQVMVSLWSSASFFRVVSGVVSLCLTGC